MSFSLRRRHACPHIFCASPQNKIAAAEAAARDAAAAHAAALQALKEDFAGKQQALRDDLQQSQTTVSTLRKELDDAKRATHSTQLSLESQLTVRGSLLCLLLFLNSLLVSPSPSFEHVV